MFQVFVLVVTYVAITFAMNFLPHPDGGLVVEIIRWCLFAFGSWILMLLFFHVKRVATDFHAITIGRPDMENLPEWAELDVDGNVQVKDDTNLK